MFQNVTKVTKKETRKSTYVTKVTKTKTKIPIFETRMTLNSYIAIFFSVIFFGKFLVMDSKILAAIFDADEISYVKPFCEKQNVKIQSQKSQEALDEDNKTLNLTIDSFCNAPFKFEVFSWESKVLTQETRAFADHSPSLPESAKDRFYPPPRA